MYTSILKNQAFVKYTEEQIARKKTEWVVFTFITGRGAKKAAAVKRGGHGINANHSVRLSRDANCVLISRESGFLPAALVVI